MELKILKTFLYFNYFNGNPSKTKSSIISSPSILNIICWYSLIFSWQLTIILVDNHYFGLRSDTILHVLDAILSNHKVVCWPAPIPQCLSLLLTAFLIDCQSDKRLLFSWVNKSGNHKTQLWTSETLARVSNFLASLGHTGRRVVLGHTLNIQTVTKTDEHKKGFK